MFCSKIVLLVTALLLGPRTSEAFGWNWIWPFTTTTTQSSSTSSSSTGSSSGSVGSNYAISIGNRENTVANLTDYGTSISGLQINLARFNGSALVSTGAAQNVLSDIIYSVTEEYRTQSEAVVGRRLAWIEATVNHATQYARELQQNEMKALLKAFSEDVRGSVRDLREPVRDCLGREVDVEDMIQSVTNRSQSGCLQTRVGNLLQIRDSARSNLTKFLNSSGDVEDLVEHCVDVQDQFDDEMSDMYKLACISSVLLRMQTDTFNLTFTVNQLTTEVDPVLSQASASLLECAVDLVSYAFEVSLGLRHWINICSSR
ncbi:uncharacterized protein LOC131684900 [Topomyia yanbarensis]|uniref:uncharacterized protein LOC131684900 n=1 Tax=Topomyia yanbarensis TaxID=2498891 RepID=UPI00273AA292|nr:uncharacterized protein LOC131684900 [Topomyia yanbarensis]